MKDKYTGHPRGFGFIKFEDLTGTGEKARKTYGSSPTNSFGSFERVDVQ